jgi:hypothetical protein
MDLETERTVRGLNKERDVQCLLFVAGVCSLQALCGRILAREMVLNGPRRSVAIIAYLGSSVQPGEKKVSGLRRNARAAAKTFGRPVSAGDREKPWRHASSAMHDIKNSFT